MGETKESFGKLLMSVLITDKDGIAINNLQSSYREMIGKPIQFQAMGYQTLELLLKSMPDVCYLQRQPNGSLVVKAVLGEKTSHIQSLVAKTRTSKSRSRPKRKIRNFDNSTAFKRNSTNRSFRQNNRENRPPMRRTPPKRYEQPPRFRTSPNYYHKQENGSSLRESAATNFNPQIPPPPLSTYTNFEKQSTNAKGMNSFTQKQTSYKNAYVQNVPNNALNGASNNSSKKQNSSTNNISISTWNSTNFNGATKNPPEASATANSKVPIPYEPKSYSINNRVITPEASISPEPISSPALVEAKTCRQMVENYAVIKGIVAKFKTLPVSRKRPGKPYYLSTLTLADLEYRSYPAEKNTEEEANEEAAKNAVDDLKLREMKALKVLPTTSCTTEEELSLMLQRILQIVEPKSNGIWHSNVQKEFEKLYEQKLPTSWLNIVREKQVIKVETITGDSEDINRFILYPNQGRVTPASPSVTPDTYVTSYVPELVYPEDDQWEVYVCHVEQDSANICIRLIEYSSEFEELDEKMNEFFKHTKKPAREIVIGNFYCTEDEGSFHRVQIEVIEGSSALCHFVDHGDYLLIDVNDIFEIPKQFLELPCQAILCELTGIEYLYQDPKTTENLIALTLDKSFVVKITNRDEIISMILYDTSTDDDIDMNKKILDMAISSSLKPNFPSSGISQAYLTHVFENGDIYLKPNGVGGVILDEIINDNSQLFEETLQATPLSQVSFSNMYVAKKDNLWRRVLVSDTPKAGAQNVKITYIDFGTLDSIPINSLVEINSISDMLVKIPTQFVLCRLNDLPPPSKEWTGRARNKLLQMVPDHEPLSVKVIPNMDASNHILPVVDLLKTNENKELISINHTLALMEELFDSSVKTEKSMAPLKRPSSISIRAQRNSQTSLLSPTLTSPSPISNYDGSGGTLNLRPLVPVEIPAVGQFLDVLVQTAANPNTFFVHARSQSLSYHKLHEKMQDFYNMEENLIENNMDLIQRGNFYAVKNEQDGLWYRGWVSQIVSRSPVFIVIYLVDYGEFIQQVDLNNIQTLYTQFRTIPMQAIKAKLAGVEPVNGDYEINHITYFQQLVQEKAFVAKIEAKENDSSSSLNTSIVTLTLIDTSTPVDVYIASLLVEKGFAKSIV